MNVLLVIAAKDFRDEEYAEPRRALEQAGHSVTVASTRSGECVGVHGLKVVATVALPAVVTAPFDAVVFVGGAGANVLFDNAQAQRIAVEMNGQHKVLGAICVGPVILARAGVLKGREATVFETETHELVKAQAHLRPSGVVVDGRIVTASGPAHAKSFGARLVAVLELSKP